ncbi:MAG: DUF4231 domain-containing protein [Bacillus sp. (in: firmicutes)]|uniref:DUF4231 domain-containing protein n=1 Tax=Bacillus marasmi TaxID=1926279 RepID=UPI0011C8C26E|nr:DUF4231 domain-containing protein [Bacillus marasmi]
MQTQMKLDVLMKDIDETIQLFEKRRDRHKNKAIILKLSSIIGSALVTVLLGLKSLQNNLISDIALMLSAFITIFNGIEGFYNHRSLWVKDVKTLTSLRELKRDLEFFIAGEPEEQMSVRTLARFKDRLQNICNDDVKTWSKIKEEQAITDNDEKSGK